MNQRAPFFITRHALDRMSSGGRIVNISSGSARYARPDVIAYAMTKGAIEVFTRTLAVQVGQRGITVNAVAPGALDTDMNAQWLHTDTEAARSAATHTASGRLATPRRHRECGGVPVQPCGSGHHRPDHRCHQRQSTLIEVLSGSDPRHQRRRVSTCRAGTQSSGQDRPLPHFTGHRIHDANRTLVRM
ncbi:SDR family NAD(P)-dependent oxidoreductase [Rhodococcus pyridinivorans]|uniref:SDR family NAD(P)-dependent oxidoreductase n=1 Tax=Rhodococcus pyridinivorans TaxID=103816 RepID=UPI002240BDCB|nr:SDR family oxidoreductase [Rhodococcus pyridinivorans]